MTAAPRAARAIACVLSGTALMLSGFRTIAWAEPCPPRAELGGDRVAVERVADELRKMGVTVASRPGATGLMESPTSDASGCSIVRAQVELDESGGIAVAVRGATRGSEGRVVSDAALAAAWIDSWTRKDIDVALWSAPPPRAAEAVVAPSAPSATSAGASAAALAGTSSAASAPPSAGTSSAASAAPSTVKPAPPAQRDTAAPASGASRWDRIAIAASYEQVWTDDDATWNGMSLSACARVAGFCLGARARLAYDPSRLYNSTGVARDDFALLATASYPVAVGTMSIAPEIGIGVGRVTTTRAEGTCKVEPPPNCDPMTDPNCEPMMPPGMCTGDPANGTMTMPKYFVGDEASHTTYAPRIAVALRIAVPLFRHVWLDGLAGVSMSPFAHSSSFAPGKTPATELLGPEQLALPGEPTSGYMLGIGIRAGAK